MFDYPQTSRAVYDSKNQIVRYKYSDGEVIQILSKYLNFTPVYVQYDKNLHGFQLPNGTFTGALAAIEYGFANLSGIEMVSIDRNTTNGVFLKSFRTLKFQFVIKKPRVTRSALLVMVNSIDIYTKIAILTCFSMFPILFYIKLKLQSVRDEGKTQLSILDSFLIVISLIINVNSKRTPASISTRIFLMVVMFYAMIQTSYIQSSIIKSLNKDIVVGDIKTLDQLLDNNYQILATDVVLSLFKNAGGNRMAKKINELSSNPSKFNLNYSSLSIKENEAVLVSELVAKEIVNSKFDKITKKTCCAIVPEVFFEFYEAMLTQRSSPFQDIFNSIIQRIIESGIQRHQVNLANFDDNTERIKRIRNGEIPPVDTKTIEFYEVEKIFFLYLILTGFAVVVFCLETIIGWFIGK